MKIDTLRVEEDYYINYLMKHRNGMNALHILVIEEKQEYTSYMNQLFKKMRDKPVMIQSTSQLSSAPLRQTYPLVQVVWYDYTLKDSIPSFEEVNDSLTPYH